MTHNGGDQCTPSTNLRWQDGHQTITLPEGHIQEFSTQTLADGTTQFNIVVDSKTREYLEAEVSTNPDGERTFTVNRLDDLISSALDALCLCPEGWVHDGAPAYDLDDGRLRTGGVCPNMNSSSPGRY